MTVCNPANVAKVKRRIPRDAQPLRHGYTWRRNVKHLAKWLAITWLALIVGGAALVAGFGFSKVI